VRKNHLGIEKLKIKTNVERKRDSEKISACLLLFLREPISVKFSTQHTERPKRGNTFYLWVKMSIRGLQLKARFSVLASFSSGRRSSAHEPLLLPRTLKWLEENQTRSLSLEREMFLSKRKQGLQRRKEHLACPQEEDAL